MFDRDLQDPEKRMRRRSRTVSWDHSVRSSSGVGAAASWGGRGVTDGGGVTAGFAPPQGPTSSSGLRDSSAIELLDDNMSISRGHSVEKVRFSASRAHSDENDEDYSASVNAILHKRLSVRKGKHQKQRRSSSPVSSMIPDDASLLSDRRRSSAFTTSSGDTAINIEDAGISQEQIFENIRLHKEVLGSVRQQPWSIRRKMKLVQQAKEYVKKHEGQLQERLAMSKSTRDILARFNILVVKQWQHTKREMANFISQIIPWELTIKEIESQFGTVVASYFTFLRWLFWVNLVISVLLAAFVVIPEILTTKIDESGERKKLLPEEEATSMNFVTLLNFEGVLQHSPIFYGYYSNRQSSDTGYRLPTAYFITGLVVYIYSFVATLRKMAANSRLSKLSEKDDECIFTWKLFTGWDYMIGNEETAHNRISSIILGFKEALLEEAERMKDKQNWKIVALRIFANLNMVWMLGSSVFAVIMVVQRSTEQEAVESSAWRKYEITVVMTLIGTFFPIAFEGLGVLENYHPRTTLRVQLARIMALNLLNLYTLTFALFAKIDEMTKDLLLLKPRLSNVTVTTAAQKITSKMPSVPTSTSLIMALALMNSTMSTTTSTATTMTTTTTTTTTTPTPTTTFLPTSGLIDLPPNCYRITVECPFRTQNRSFDTIFTTTTGVPADVTRRAGNISDAGARNTTDKTMATTTDKTTTMTTDKTTTTTTAVILNAVSDYSGGGGGGDDDNVSTTFGPAVGDGGKWSSSAEPKSENATDGVSKTDLTLEILVDIVDREASSENTATESSTLFVDPNDSATVPTGRYWTAAEPDTTSPMTGSPPVNPTTESVLGPTDDEPATITSSFADPVSGWSDDPVSGWPDDPVSSWSPDPISSSSADPVSNWYADPASSWFTDPVSSSSTESIRFDTESIPNENGLPKTGDFSSSRKRAKRQSEVVYNGYNCSRIVCLSRPAVSNVTEALKNYQEFSEQSNEAFITSPTTTTQHEDAPNEDLSLHAPCLDLQTRRKLRKLCWETMFGQELVKLTVMDLVSTIISTIFVDFARAVFVRYMNRCWCWNLEKRFPQYGDFKIAENILHLVNNQGMVWMGMFFSPGLPIINVVKLMIMMYVRSWAVLTCNVPHDVVFRASRSNNFYLGLLLTMLFLCVLPVGYAIVWIEPSWHCGPFSQYKKIYHIFTHSIKKAVPNPTVHRVLDYIASPGIVIPLLLLLILIIYYLASLTSSLREANNDLKTQLRRERTEERRKMFLLVNNKKRGDDDGDYTCMDTTLAKWRQIMPDNKMTADRPNFMFEFAEKKLTENDVLDKVREKLVHMETDDLQQPEEVDSSGKGVQQQQQQHQQQQQQQQQHQQQQQQQHLHHHHHHHHQQHLHHHHHLRRPSRSEEPRDVAALRKWKKTKPTVSRRPSTDSESSDQSEAIPEIRLIKSGGFGEPSASAGLAGATACGITSGQKIAAGGGGEQIGGGGGGGTDGGVEQPVKQRARLKLAQILYKEARRRRQKYVEELQNQQE